MEYQVFNSVTDVEKDNYQVLTVGSRPVDAMMKGDNSEWLHVRCYYNGEYNDSFWYNGSVNEYTQGCHLVREL